MKYPTFPRDGTKRRQIVTFLLRGPATGAEIADLIDDITPTTARTLASMRHQGHIQRVDGKTGRGTIAIYGLTDWTRKIAEGLR